MEDGGKGFIGGCRFIVKEIRPKKKRKGFFPLAQIGHGARLVIRGKLAT